MALDLDTVGTLVRKTHMPILYDQIFQKNHYLFRKLKDKAKTFNGIQIVQPLEYANISNASWLTEFGELPLVHGDPVTDAKWDPTFLTDVLLISKKDELMATSDEAVLNIINVRMKNMQKGMELKAVRNLWARSATTNAWLPLISLLSNSVTTGGIAIADATWWETPTLVAATVWPDCTADEASLLDPTKGIYIKRILQRGIAKAAYLTGEDPDCIVMPRYLFDLCEFGLDPQKRGNLADAGVAAMGFNNIKYRNSVLLADEDMTYAQTGDTDGYMYFLNTDYLYLYFNSGAKFTMGKFVEAIKGNYSAAKCNAFGGMAVSNRAAHCVVTGLPSPKTYASA